MSVPNGHPIQFIIEKKGSFQVTDEALRFLNSINTPFSVVAVCGPYRTGKSYLLNRFLNMQKGFSIGPSVNPETRGMYLWNKIIQMKVPGSNKVIPALLVDTEGISSVQQHKTHDVKLFSLGVLFCDYLIYNTVGVIDERAIEMLSLISEFSKWLSSSAEGQLDPDMFPAFTWVLRDFALELVDENNVAISSNQYLENCLKERYEPGQQEKNETKRALRSYFKNRDCVCLVRPVMDEKDLKRIDELPVQKLRPEFVKGVEELLTAVKRKLSTKKIFNKEITGPAFAEFVSKYVSTMNTDKIPRIAETWNSVVQIENTKLVEQEIHKYYTFFEKHLKVHVLSSDEFRSIHNKCMIESRKHLQEKLLGNHQQAFHETLEQRVNQLFDKFEMANHIEYEKRCTSLLDGLYGNLIVKPLNERSFNTISDMINAWKSLSQQYLSQAKGNSAVECLNKFTFQHMMECFTEFYRQFEEKYKLLLKQEEEKLKELTESLRKREIDCVRYSSESNMQKKTIETLTDKLTQYEKEKSILKENVESMRVKYEETVQENRTKIRQLELKNTEQFAHQESLSSQLELQSQQHKRDITRLEQEYRNQYEKQLNEFKNQYEKEIQSKQRKEAELQAQLEKEIQSKQRKEAELLSQFQQESQLNQRKEAELLAQFERESQLKIAQFEQEIQSKQRKEEELRSQLEKENQLNQRKEAELQAQLERENQLKRNEAELRYQLEKEIQANQRKEAELQAQLERESQSKHNESELLAQLSSKNQQITDLTIQLVNTKNQGQQEISRLEEEINNYRKQFQKKEGDYSKEVEILRNQFQQQLADTKSQAARTESEFKFELQKERENHNNLKKEMANLESKWKEMNNNLEYRCQILEKQLLEANSKREEAIASKNHYQQREIELISELEKAIEMKNQYLEQIQKANEYKVKLEKERQAHTEYVQEFRSLEAKYAEINENLDNRVKDLEQQLKDAISLRDEIKESLRDVTEELNQEKEKFQIREQSLKELEIKKKQSLELTLKGVEGHNEELIKELEYIKSQLNRERQDKAQLESLLSTTNVRQDLEGIMQQLNNERSEKERILNRNEEMSKKLDLQVKKNEKLKAKLEELKSAPVEKKSNKKKRESTTDSTERAPKRRTVESTPPIDQQDPEKLSIQQIKSYLTHAGKDYVLPTETKKKSFYVELFRKHLLKQ
jgi:hypothetical protein